MSENTAAKERGRNDTVCGTRAFWTGKMLIRRGLKHRRTGLHPACRGTGPPQEWLRAVRIACCVTLTGWGPRFSYNPQPLKMLLDVYGGTLLVLHTKSRKRFLVTSPTPSKSSMIQRANCALREDVTIVCPDCKASRIEAL